MYEEALPILYSKNTFEFIDPKHLRVFKRVGLIVSKLKKNESDQKGIPVFNMKPCLQGRLALIRRLSLELTTNTHDFSYDHRGKDIYIQGHAPVIRRNILKAWEPFLLRNPDKKNAEYNRFPNLEVLYLTFSEYVFSGPYLLFTYYSYSCKTSATQLLEPFPPETS